MGPVPTGPYLPGLAMIMYNKLQVKIIIKLTQEYKKCILDEIMKKFKKDIKC